MKNKPTFDIHVSFRVRDDACNVIDLSERRLMMMLKLNKNAQYNDVLTQLLDDYVSGRVYVGWREGRPVPYKVMKTG